MYRVDLNTDLNLAFKRKDLLAASLLIEQKAIVDINYKYTRAIFVDGDLDLIQLIIDKTSYTIRNMFEHACAAAKHESTIEFLISKDPNVDIGIGALNACSTGNIVVVNMLLKLGVPNVEECMHRACLVGSLELVKLILKYGAKEFDKALQNVVLYGYFNIKIIKLLLDNGAKYKYVPDHCIMKLLDVGVDYRKLGIRALYYYNRRKTKFDKIKAVLIKVPPYLPEAIISYKILQYIEY